MRMVAFPANKPLALAHGAYQKIISCYAHEDRRKGRGMMAELIESLAVKGGAPGCPQLVIVMSDPVVVRCDDAAVALLAIADEHLNWVL